MADGGSHFKSVQESSERAQDVQLLKLQQAKREAIASQKPEPDAWRSPLSFLVFWWYLRRVLCLGWRKTLVMADLPRLNRGLFTDVTHGAFVRSWTKRAAALQNGRRGEQAWQKCKEGRNWSLLLEVLVFSYFWYIAGSVLLHLVSTAAGFAFPILLEYITNYLELCGAESEAAKGKAYLYAVLNFVCPLLSGLFHVHSNRLATLAQVKTSAAITAELFRKSMRMSNASQQSIERGKIINLMSADVNNVINFLHPAMADIVVAPITIVVAVVLLYHQIGWAVFVGLGVLVVATPISFIFINKLTNLQGDMLVHTDRRIALVNQLLAGMKSLKMYAWEAAQEARIQKERKREMRKLGHMVPYYTLMEGTMVSSPILAAIASFLAFAATAPPERFTPAAIFAAVALFGILKPPIEDLPHSMVEAGAAIVSLRRLTMFLTLEDRQDEGNHPFQGGNGMAVEQGEFAYPKATGPKFEFSDDEDDEDHGDEEEDAESDQEDHKGMPGKKNGKPEVPEPKVAMADVPEPKVDVHVKLPGASDDCEDGLGDEDDEGSFTLRNIDFRVKAGELLCVIGRVGSGKSSLMSAVLGDMERTAGTVRTTGSIAYVAQSAWIVNATVRGNITFGKPFDQARYDAVVEATSLEHDFKILPGGDMTEIGEKGVNLSGGQKQRISMARAAYADADLYIMDDPLSAVDVHVGKHIFTKCITGLLRAKAVLLVTNQLQYAPEADSVLYLEEGEMVACGKYTVVVQNEGFASLLNEYEATAGEDNDDAGGQEDMGINVERDRAALMHATSGSGMHAIEVARMQAVVDQEQLRSMSSMAPRNFTIPDPLALASFRSIRLRPSVRSIDEATLEPSDLREPLLGPRASTKGLRGRMSTPAGGLLPRGSTAAPMQPGSGMLKSRATWAPGTAQPESRGSLQPRKSAKAAANLYIPNLAEAADGDGLGNGKAGVESGQPSPAPAPACPSNEPLSPFETIPLEDSNEKPVGGSEKAAETKKEEKAGASMMTEEEQDEGQVSFRVYWAYFKSGSGLLSILVLITLSAAEAMNQYQSVWLQWWTASDTHGCNVDPINHGPVPPKSLNSQYFPGYVGCGLAYAAGLTLATAGIYIIGLLSSIKLHDKLITTVARAPMWLFDTTPAGRILNRFSKDTYDMDHELPNVIFALGSHLLELAGLIIIISIYQVYFLAGAVPLLLVYICVHKFYTRSYIELQRIDAVTRSPVFSHFAESLAGMDTIRAYGYQERFAAMSDDRVDYNHRGFYALHTGDQWLTLTLDFIGALLSFLVSILVVALKGQLGPATSALILERVGEMSVKLQVIVTNAATMERRFNSVERILEYHQLPQEKAREIPDNSPPPAWPTEGVIQYRDVWMRYREGLDPVLKGVTFEVKSGEAVGIVGRTGSGKSSLIVALFRLAEPHQGAIMLDGHNLLDLGLQDVRGRIAAIPQEPILFSGTIRSNVDPYSQHDDADIWLALERVNLKDIVSGMNGLASRVAESGENWSVGQRQLLCVARALLRKPKVLVLDEATASVDGETDAFIQKAIRQNFAGSTIMTIAHRLNTIMDSSKVLVMHDGKRLEYDSVPNLLRMQNGAFRAMVEGAGISHEALSH